MPLEALSRERLMTYHADSKKHLRTQRRFFMLQLFLVSLQLGVWLFKPTINAAFGVLIVVACASLSFTYFQRAKKAFDELDKLVQMETFLRNAYRGDDNNEP